MMKEGRYPVGMSGPRLLGGRRWATAPPATKERHVQIDLSPDRKKVLSCDADKWRADKASKPRGRALHNRLGMFQAVPVLGGRDVANGCSTPTRPGSSLRISRVSIASGLSSLVCLTWGLVKPVT